MAKAKSNSTSPARQLPTGESWRVDWREVPIGRIGPGRLNTRADFDEAKLEELAASIRRHGVLEPIIVRPMKGKTIDYELVAGARRLAASRLADLEKISAVVRELDDRQAREIAVLENLQREDLNAIEEARGFEALLDLGKPEGLTQQGLADRLGCSQAHVANRIRLLGLPEKWRKKIISGEITGTQGRQIATLKGRAKILDGLEKELKRARSWRKPGVGAALDGEDFEEALGAAMSNTTRRMVGRRYEPKLHRLVDVFTPTDQQRKALEIIEDPTLPEDNEVACNVKLWEKLQAEHVKRLVAAAKAQDDGKAKRGKAGNGQPERKLTPAEKKRLEEEARAKAKQQRRIYQQRLHVWRTNWQRWLIAERLAQDDVSTEELTRLLIYFAVGSATWNNLTDAEARQSRLIDLLKDRHIKVPKRKAPGVWDPIPALMEALIELPNAAAIALLGCRLIAGWFWDEKKGPRSIVPPADVEAIAGMLGVELAKEWKTAQTTSIGEQYFSLHTKDQLVALAKELKLKLDGAASKADLVKRFTTSKRPLPMPKEIAKARG